LLCVACVAGASAQRSAGPPTAATPDATAFFDQLHGAYQSGNYAVLSLRIRTAGDCKRLEPALGPSTKQLTQIWSRENAAFVIDLADAMSACSPAAFWNLLSDGRNYVIERPVKIGVKRAPAPLGVDVNDDAFELMWHKVAVAMLLREAVTTAADVYLDTLERRYQTGPAAKAAHTTLDPRFLLMRGMVGELQSLSPGAVRVSTSAPVDTSFSPAVAAPVGPPIPEAQVTSSLVLAAKAFEQAAEADTTGLLAPEAYVRFAVMQLRIGKPADALTTLNRAKMPTPDLELAYWYGLWKGRILDALNRPADAAVAYGQALDVSSTGQAAAVGLALSLFKQNHRDEAAEAAARVRDMPSSAPDPWWTYTKGDARFIDDWLADLRKAMR
jgi:hypothetical protein